MSQRRCNRRKKVNSFNTPILFQGECSLEEYVGLYMDLYDDVTWEEEKLTQSFWGGLRDPLAQLILVENLDQTFLEFVDHTLWVCGSDYVVEDFPLKPVPNPVCPESIVNPPEPEPIVYPPEAEPVTCQPEIEHVKCESTQEDSADCDVCGDSVCGLHTHQFWPMSPIPNSPRCWSRPVPSPMICWSRPVSSSPRCWSCPVPSSMMC